MKRTIVMIVFIASLIIAFAIATMLLTGCEDILGLFERCRPTARQEADCRYGHYQWDGDYTAQGRLGTNGNCGWNEYECVDLYTGSVRQPLCAEDGGIGGFAGECLDHDGQGGGGGANNNGGGGGIEPDAT